MAETSSFFIFKVIFPALAGVVIIGTLSGIVTGDGGVEDQSEGFFNAIESFDGEITLGTQENRADNAEVFREAVMFNAFAAQHCGFIERIGQLNSVEGTDNTQKTKESIFYPHSGYDHDFDYLREKEDFSMGCSDVGSVSSAAEEKIQSNIPVVKKLGNEFREEWGKDQEGKFGRMNFEVKKTFHTQDNKIALFNFQVDDKAFPENADLWKAQRWMSFVPADLGIEGAYSACGRLKGPRPVNQLLYGEESLTRYSDLPSKEGFYAYRVRMKNVPMVKENAPKTDKFSLCNTQDNYEGPNVHFNRFFLGKNTNQDEGHVKFVMCENATGYIQSNAGNKIEDDSEATNDDDSAWPEDVVYPKVEIRQDADSCIEDRVNIDGMKSSGNRVMEINGNLRTCDLEGAVYSKIDARYAKCGLELRRATITGNGGSFKYYTPAWFLPDGLENWDKVKLSFKVSETESGYELKDVTADYGPNALDEFDSETKPRLIVTGKEEDEVVCKGRTVRDNGHFEFGDIQVDGKGEVYPVITLQHIDLVNGECDQSTGDFQRIALTFDGLEDGDTELDAMAK